MPTDPTPINRNKSNEGPSPVQSLQSLLEHESLHNSEEHGD